MKALQDQNGFLMMGTFDTWTIIGPTTGFYYDYGNISSRFTTVQYDPNNSNIIYLDAANGGATRTDKSDFENSLSSGLKAIESNNSNIIYYRTGEANFSTTTNFGKQKRQRNGLES